MTNLNIWYGSNENAEFSNLAERRFFHDDYWYETVEHAYQTLKSGEFDTRTYYRPWAPGKALMEKLITKSFTQNAYALNKLADIPQSQKITHHQDRGVWKTEFPRILEELRRRNYN